MKRLLSYALAVTVASFAAAAGVHAQSLNQNPPAAPSPEGTDCGGGTFSSGAGPTLFTTCVSTAGNVMQFNSQGSEAIRNGVLLEGYILCGDGGGPYYDVAADASGWGAPTVGTPGVLPITVTRTTSDGRFTLTQKYAKDNAEHDLTITMTVRNNSTSAVNNVKLVRVADFDVDENFSGSFSDLFDRGINAVWARQTRSVSLTAQTLGTPHTTSIRLFDFMPTSCDIASDTTPQTYDGLAIVQYNLGSMKPGSAKTLKYVYRAY